MTDGVLMRDRTKRRLYRVFTICGGFRFHLDVLSKARKVIGVKQTKRALENGEAVQVFFARDAEARLTAPVRALCEASGVPLLEVESMRALGQACGIAVGAAVAAILR